MTDRSPPRVWNEFKPIARQFRQESTPAEAKLWRSLRAGLAGQAKFRRQHAIGTYIVDYYCAAANLVIEVDGPIHERQKQRDQDRQAYLEMLGLNVLRMTNEDILQRHFSSLETIRRLIEGPS